MKRLKQVAEDTKKGVVISLSDVVEVTYTKDTSFHKKGDKRLVSLPLALKFKWQGKISMNEDALKEVKELESSIK